MVSKEQHKAFEARVYPRVEAASSLVVSYKDDNEQMKDCVAAFDATMCLKANKQEVAGLEKRVEDEYMLRKELKDLIQSLEASA